MTASDSLPRVPVDRLSVGMYIHLDLGWMDHPFSFNQFKIKSEAQIATLRSLGLSELRWNPDRSDSKPLPPSDTPPPPPPPRVDDPATQALLAAKHARQERVRAQRERLGKVERAFADATKVVQAISKEIYARPRETVEKAGALVNEMVSALLDAPEVAVQVMSGKAGSEEIYQHSLNVSVLSMMIARELKLPAADVAALGVAGLFHDIGLADVPSRILLKTDPLTKAEREVRESHCRIGTELGAKAGLPPRVLALIFQHHEFFDGSGYPRGLKGEAIDPLARLLVIANQYDNLCNPPHIALAHTPHEALSLMFAQQRSRFDLKILQQFIQSLGVYPPGTIVRLSNEATAMVVSINPSRPLKPSVLVYDPGVPKDEAIILELDTEPEVSISKAIRPGQLPPPIYDYLSPRKRVSYYFDAQAEAGRSR